MVIPVDRRIYKLRDSKTLTEHECECLYERVVDWCYAWSVGHVSPLECDTIGMSAAQRLAARRAIDGLCHPDGAPLLPDAVVLDGNWDFVGHPITRKLVKGDARCLSIAAASIVAKVTRDRLIRADSASFPGFDFAKNKGYPGPSHKVALQAYGPTAIHRRSWAFMDALSWRGLERRRPNLADRPGSDHNSPMQLMLDPAPEP